MYIAHVRLLPSTLSFCGQSVNCLRKNLSKSECCRLRLFTLSAVHVCDIKLNWCQSMAQVSHSVYSVLLFTVPQWHVIALLIKWPLKVITWENPWRHQPLLWYKQTGHQWTHGSDAAFWQITVTTCYSALIGEQSIVMSMSVCLSVCVCLSAIIASELHILSSPSFWWPWLSSPLMAQWYVTYFRFYWWCHICT